MHGVSAQVEKTSSREREKRMLPLRAEIRRAQGLDPSTHQSRRLRRYAPRQCRESRRQRRPRDQSQGEAFGNLVRSDAEAQRRAEVRMLSRRHHGPAVESAMQRRGYQQRQGESVQTRRAVIVAVRGRAGRAHRINKTIHHKQCGRACADPRERTSPAEKLCHFGKHPEDRDAHQHAAGKRHQPSRYRSRGIQPHSRRRAADSQSEDR